jgi:phage shock protein C
MKKLKRSRGNRLIFGVCGGIAEYFNIDATIVRVAWFLLALPSFGTLGLAYLVCGFIIPEDDGFIHPDDQKNYNTMNEKSPLLIGLGLIVVGAYLLSKMFFPQIMDIYEFWPVLLIVLGIYILINQNKDK